MTNLKSKMLSDTKIITGKVRFSYAYVWEPVGEDENKKYSVSLLIPKEDKETLKNIKKAIDKAYESKKEVFKNKKPSTLYSIIHDGDEERAKDKEYKGCYFLNASSKIKPEIIDSRKVPITDTTEFYSGCYGHASLNFYVYDVKGKKGVACGLNNLLKTEDGENLTGRTSAVSDFEDFEIEGAEDFADDDIDLSVEDDDFYTAEGIEDDDLPF